MSSTNHTQRLRIAARLAVGGATVLGALALNTDAAAAQSKECELVAQPYMGQYNLAVENAAGQTTSLIDVEQHHRHETPATVLRVSLDDTRVVLWAQTRFPAVGHDSWGAVLPVHPTECRWADGTTYDATTINGVRMQDSVIIRDVAAPATTTSTSSPTPTTVIAFTPTTGPVPQRTEATDPAPTSTTSTTSETTSTTVQEPGAPDPTPPGPGAPTLPATGSNPAVPAIGAALAGLGLALCAASRRASGVRW